MLLIGLKSSLFDELAAAESRLQSAVATFRPPFLKIGGFAFDACALRSTPEESANASRADSPAARPLVTPLHPTFGISAQFVRY